MAWWNKAEKVAKIKQKQPATIQIALSQAINKGNGCTFQVWWVDPSNRATRQQISMPVVDAREFYTDIHSYIRSTWGGGDWMARIFSPAGQMLSSYPINVNHDTLWFPKNYKAANSGDRDGYRAGGGGDAKMVDFLIADRKESRETELKRLEFENQRIERQYSEMAKQTDKYVELISGNKGGGMLEDLTVTLFNNVFAKDQNRISDMRDMMELGKLFVPQVQPESEMTQLLGTLGTLATAFLTRNTGATPSSAAQAVSGYIDQIPKDQIAAMLANKSADEITAFLNQLTGTLSPALGAESVSLPAPGERPAEQIPPAQQTSEPVTEANTPTPGGVPVASQTPPESTRPPDPHLKVTDRMITQWREDILAGVDPSRLARSLIGIANYAGSLEEPPAVLRGLVEVTDEDFEEVFQRFYESIPELAGSPDVALRLKMELLRQFSAAHDEHLRAELEIAAALEEQASGTAEQTEAPNGITQEQSDVELMGGSGGDDAAESQVQDQQDGEGTVGETDDASQVAAG